LAGDGQRVPAVRIEKQFPSGWERPQCEANAPVESCDVIDGRRPTPAVAPYENRTLNQDQLATFGY